MRYQLGFDIGGTFTDFALLDTANGQFEIFKTLTTPDDPAQGALDGTRSFLEQDGWDGLVSIKRAREIYGVTIDPDTMQVDESATIKRRQELLHDSE